MTEELIQEWLSEFGALDPTQIRSFATEQEHNIDITLCIFNILEERTKYAQLIDPICSQLFEFYRTREVELQRFALQFIPVLIRHYLGCVAHGDKRSCRSIETLLIGIYNLEIVDEDGQPKQVSFRLPSIAQSSIYHEPISLGPSFLTTNVLKRLEECNSKLVSWGPLSQVESLNAQNRLNVMTALMFLFNRHLSRINNKITLESLCKSILKLVTQGFYRPGHVQRSSYGSTDSSASNNIRSNQSQQPRIPLSSQLLLELLHSLYYAAFNGQEYLANQSIETIHHRACYESFVDVQLLANAIKHSLRLTMTGQTMERPMGISMPMTSTNTPSVSKSMITNASFRIKKLPDDLEDELVANLMTNSSLCDGKQNLHKEMLTKKLNTYYHTQSANKKKKLHRIEPEAQMQPRRDVTARHSKSCDNSPKHSPSRRVNTATANSSTSSLLTSPPPRQYKITNSFGVKIRDRSTQSKANRSSADARLFDTAAEDDDVLQTYVVSGRPAKDIPIQNKEDANPDGKNLISISEEHEDDVVATAVPEKKTSKQIKDAVPKSLPKLPTFSGLGKKLKDKDQKQAPASKNGGTTISPDSVDNQSKKVAAAAQKEGVAINKSNRNSITALTLSDAVNGDVASKKPSNNNNNPENVVKMVETITTEKVSLVSDSLQEDTSQSVSHDDDATSIMLEEPNDDNASSMIPLMTLHDSELKSSMQVSSV